MEDTLIKTKYLIAGNSAGAIGAAEAIREIDTGGSLTIVSEEPYPAYSRPLISKLLTGERSLDRILFRSPGFYEKNNINLLSGRSIKNLIPDNHLAVLDDGEEISWDKLLLATGGKPVMPSIAGSGKKGVFNFINIGHALAISEYIRPGQKALVIGGGLIGLSVSEALHKRGIEVTIVELKDRILNTIVDNVGSNMAAQAIKKTGINILTGCSVTSIEGSATVKEAVLNTGLHIPADIIIVAIGVLPRTELASSAGIKTNRGIVVDEHMATSHPDIYACGDASEAYNFLSGKNEVIPIWPNAYMGGMTAGRNMAGSETVYPPCTVMNSLNYFGLDIASAGIVNIDSLQQYEVLNRQSVNSYKKVVLRDGKIVGLLFIRDIEKSGMLFGLMRDEVNVEAYRNDLLNDDFGFAYLPQEIRSKKLNPDRDIPNKSLVRG